MLNTKNMAELLLHAPTPSYDEEMGGNDKAINPHVETEQEWQARLSFLQRPVQGDLDRFDEELTDDEFDKLFGDAASPASKAAQNMAGRAVPGKYLDRYAERTKRDLIVITGDDGLPEAA